MTRTARPTGKLTPRGVVSRAGRAFSLLEVMVAVGAVAVIAVGLAAIFSAVGKTVSGGRRASLLNTYANLIESQMRRDFESMTREGFLVIRQQYVDVNGDGQVDPRQIGAAQPDRVALFVGEPVGRQRARRVDEIMYFAQGEFTSARRPLDPNVVVRSTSARIYYGHGQKQRPNYTLPSGYLQPSPTDLNGDLTARLGLNTPNNPNRYAGEWTLLRHVTLLADVSPTVRPHRAGLLFDVNGDTPAPRPHGRQGLAVRPEHRRVRHLPLHQPPPPQRQQPEPDAHRARANNTIPRFSSGIVDVATTSLQEIRRQVMCYPFLPQTIESPTQPPVLAPWDNRYVTTLPAPVVVQPGTPTPLDVIHEWMSDAMPTESRIGADGAGQAPTATAPFYRMNNQALDPVGVRMRYESTAPDIIAAMATSGAAAAAARSQAIRLGDQAMLEASSFLPRCSEFVVEWTFGQVSPDNGQMIWHGPIRSADSNGDGIVDGGEVLTRPYPFYADGSQSAALAWTFPRRGTTNPGVHPVTDRLIYGRTPQDNDASMTSYFGFTDPTFNRDLDGNNAVSNGDAEVSTLPWRWPTLIRITITLSDPIDPTVESTFQYIFNCPPTPRN